MENHNLGQVVGNSSALTAILVLVAFIFGPGGSRELGWKASADAAGRNPATLAVRADEISGSSANVTIDGFANVNFS